MAKNRQRLTRESIQAYLKDSDDKGDVAPDAETAKLAKKSTKVVKKDSQRKSTKGLGGNTISAVTRATGRLTGTLGGVLAQEVEHSDFKTRMISFVIGVSVAAVMLITLSLIPNMKAAEAFAYDLRMKLNPVEVPMSGSIVHLDIDNGSLSTIGRWPWDRELWAGFLHASKDAGVKNLFFDVEFSDPQQEAVDRNAVDDMKEWMNSGLVQLLDQSSQIAMEPLSLAISKMQMALADLSNPDDSVRSQAAKDLEAARNEVSQVLTALIQTDAPTKIVDRLKSLTQGIRKDHDDILAAAIRESGNVFLPISFEHSHLIAPDRVVPWNQESIEICNAYFQAAFDRMDPSSATRDGFEAYLRGKTFTSNEGETFTFSEELATKTASELFETLQREFLYRYIRKWYETGPQWLIDNERVMEDKPDDVLRRHLNEYVSDYHRATRILRSADHQVFEPLRSLMQQDSGAQSNWRKFAVEQLHRFYSWVLLTRGHGFLKGETTTPWFLPAAEVIEDFDSKEYDVWKVHDETTAFYRKELPFFRDTDVSPPIFRLLAACKGNGFVVVEPDADGKYRSVPLVLLYKDSYTHQHHVIFQMGLTALFEQLGVDRRSVRVTPGEYLTFKADSALLAALRDNKLSGVEPSGTLEEVHIKIDSRGHMMVNYVGEVEASIETIFRHLPAASLMNVAANKADQQREMETSKEAVEEISARLLSLNSDVFERIAEDGSKVSSQSLNEFFNFPLAKSVSLLGDLPLRPNQKAKLLTDLYATARLLTELPGEFGAIREEPWGANFEPLLVELSKKDALRDRLHAGYIKRVLEALEVPASALDSSGAVTIDKSLLDKLKSLNGQVKTDLGAPFGLRYRLKITNPLKKKLEPADMDKLEATLMRMGTRFLDPDYDFDADCKALTELGNKAAGGSLSAQPEDDTIREIFTKLPPIGRLLTNGPALRQLLMNKEHALSSEELQEAVDPASPLHARYTAMVEWEKPLLLQADMIADNDSWLQSGMTSTQSPAGMLAGAHRDLESLTLNEIRSYRAAYALPRLKVQELQGYLAKALDGLKPQLEGRAVIIGAAATALGDNLATPLAARMAGPAIHSNAFNTALYNIEPRPAPVMAILIAVVAVLVLSFATARLSATTGAITFGIVVLVTYSGLGGMFGWLHKNLPTLTIMSPFFFSFLAIQGYRYAVEYRAKLKLKSQFGKFLSEEAVEELQKNPDALKLGGDETYATVFFSDIAGFTPISESMSPVRLIHFLNDYMNRMCEPIKDSKGYVDKFIGDAIMAIWNKPVPTPDHAARACKAAIRDTQLLAQWNRERAERGELKVGARIGVATGPMVVGMMGTDWRLNFTAIGDTVNLGARLEAANKQYGTQVMINNVAYEEAKDAIVAHLMDNIAVKGKKKGVPVYHLVGLAGETDMKYIQGCKIYTEAFDAYQNERWAEALKGFKEAKEMLPPPYDVSHCPSDLLIERCEHLVDATREERMKVLGLKNIDDEWDGVWKLTSK